LSLDRPYSTGASSLNQFLETTSCSRENFQSRKHPGTLCLALYLIKEPHRACQSTYPSSSIRCCPTHHITFDGVPSYHDQLQERITVGSHKQSLVRGHLKLATGTNRKDTSACHHHQCRNIRRWELGDLLLWSYPSSSCVQNSIPRGVYRHHQRHHHQL
ncbi:hypothetical protein BDR04DRAFT_1145711, partial [Suillus decipiens]